MSTQAKKVVAELVKIDLRSKVPREQYVAVLYLAFGFEKMKSICLELYKNFMEVCSQSFRDLFIKKSKVNTSIAIHYYI